MYRPVSSAVENNQLKIQELVVRYADMNLYAVSGSNSIVLIGESVSSVVSVSWQKDAGPSSQLLASSAISIVDSVAFTPGANANGIKLNNVNMLVNDRLVIKYTTVN